jgi:RimJ/RimL family protein N-acetyltransferase
MADSAYPPLNVAVHTPRLSLLGATDDLLMGLVPAVRAGIAVGTPLGIDDPSSFYKDSPEREWSWLRRMWGGRGNITDTHWRLYLVVVVDGTAIGMQDVWGDEFASFGTVESFSWLVPGQRRRGLGKEMRQAVLHLAFAGFGAREANSGAFVDNVGSNRISESLGYERNGIDWATRNGEPAEIQRWRLKRERWAQNRRNDIELAGVTECLPVFRIAPQA